MSRSTTLRATGAAALALVASLVTGCGATESTSGASSSPSASRGPSASATVATVDLGPDPGAAQYRSLDLCAMVDVDAVLAEAGPDWASATLSGSGPGACVLTGSRGWVAWRVSATRADLPTSVVGPVPASDTVRTSPAGTVVTDAQCGQAHVVSGGYVIAVDTPPVVSGGCAILETVTDAVRASLSAGPPRRSTPAGSVSVDDLCRRFATATELGAGVADTVRPTTADSRACEARTSTGAVLTLGTGLGPLSLQKYTREERPRDGEVLVDESECTAVGRVDEGSGAGVPDPYWVTLALAMPDGAACPAGGGGLVHDAVEQLLAADGPATTSATP
ncbi:hypothetical protein [Arthrobacter sp. NEB 688]|uniref:hypothetical protein n=1 Tax=Arthrobacter sp. NEB 688 TaxID=904039 RepID=UPI001563BB3A|nr:hypothetical protein [Arthrobacter sp. NEB 688]QKE84607.1 hypothetical protein HL663_12105 [Arthrobacter sp. NEB 688]